METIGLGIRIRLDGIGGMVLAFPIQFRSSSHSASVGDVSPKCLAQLSFNAIRWLNDFQQAVHSWRCRPPALTPRHQAFNVFGGFFFLKACANVEIDRLFTSCGSQEKKRNRRRQLSALQKGLRTLIFRSMSLTCALKNETPMSSRWFSTGSDTSGALQ